MKTQRISIPAILTIVMNMSRLIILVLGIVSMTLAGQQPGSSPLGPISFLVGGVWRGELPAAANGEKTSIEMRCDWTPNHQAIRFDSAFVRASQPAPYTSGMYCWNAAKDQIVFTYCDAEGNLTEGVVFQETNTLRHEFTITDRQGKTEKARAIITPHLPDNYSNEIFVEKDGAWQKIANVSYRRGK